MTDDHASLRDDIAFLRELARDDGKGLAREGATMVIVGLIMGGARTGNPHLVLWVFPVIMFTLYGAAWTVAWAVKRQAWLFIVGAGCFATAFAEGALVSSPYQWLALSAGLILWVALPGAAILRQTRSRPG